MASSPRIVTATPNPALDLATATERIMPDHKMRCRGGRVDPGGGGVNVSRVLHRWGASTLAVHTLGGVTGEAYARALAQEAVPARAVPIRGDTRQNVTVRETATGEHYRFVLEGPALSADEWEAFVAATLAELRPGDWLVASGSLPPGVPDTGYAELLAAARDLGARCAVDAAGPVLAAAVARGVDLAKPSRRELCELVGLPDSSDDDRLADAAQELIRRRPVGVLVVSLGARGAMLVDRTGVRRAPAIPVTADSPVGAGDSLLAGVVLRLAQGRGADEALRAGLAAAAATVASAGTRLGTREEIERFEAAG
ncbi:MAG: 1-phosphofructokinase family hexose kinase [Actinomycetales bacterium]|nr:1-phosphofructokinase family hexose kinase [Actinomycetales bacterium]